jgi:diguanylate cyclase (GGDEF)-like protein
MRQTISLELVVDNTPGLKHITSCDEVTRQEYEKGGFLVVPVEHYLQLKKQSELSGKDPLTGLPNRDPFNKELKARYSENKRHSTSTALLYIDADKFKAINDNYGHPFGDKVLCGIAETLADSLRTEDTAARLGGEEFGIILPHTDLAGAYTIADRIRQRVAGINFSGEKITISTGVAQFRPEDEEYTAIMDRADHALYHAKRNGRNRVILETHMQPQSLWNKYVLPIFSRDSGNPSYGLRSML